MKFWLLFLGGIKKLSHQIATRSKMHTTPVSGFTRIEQSKAVMVFLKIVPLAGVRTTFHRNTVLRTVTKTKYLAPAWSNRSTHALALNFEAVKLGMKSSYTTFYELLSINHKELSVYLSYLAKCF